MSQQVIEETCKECHGEGTIRKLKLVPPPPKPITWPYMKKALKIIFWDIVSVFLTKKRNGWQLTVISWGLAIVDLCVAFCLWPCAFLEAGPHRDLFFTWARITTAPWVLWAGAWLLVLFWTWIQSVTDRTMGRTPLD